MKQGNEGWQPPRKHNRVVQRDGQGDRSHGADGRYQRQNRPGGEARRKMTVMPRRASVPQPVVVAVKRSPPEHASFRQRVRPLANPPEVEWVTRVELRLRRRRRPLRFLSRLQS